MSLRAKVLQVLYATAVDDTCPGCGRATSELRSRGWGGINVVKTRMRCRSCMLVTVAGSEPVQWVRSRHSLL